MVLTFFLFPMLLVSQFSCCYFLYLSRLIERHVRELGGPIVIGDSLFTVGEGKAGSAAGLPSPSGGLHIRSSNCLFSYSIRLLNLVSLCLW